MIAWLMPHDQIANFAHLVMPFLEKLYKKFPDWPPEQALQDAHDGEIELWLTFDEEDNKPLAVIGTQIAPEGEEKVLRVLLLGGAGLKGWASVVESEIKAHAARNECDAVRFRGRKGWQLIYPELKIVDWDRGLPVYEVRV
jgi:hypothetical protein